jgi:hypothetical protein
MPPETLAEMVIVTSPDESGPVWATAPARRAVNGRGGTEVGPLATGAGLAAGTDAAVPGLLGEALGPVTDCLT